MPTYEYACTNCQRRFEVVQRFSDAPLETCEVCGGTLKRVYHPVGIVLKGSGFYSTDNRGGKALTPGKDKESSGSGESTSSTPSKGESKPAESKPAKKSDSEKKSSPGKSDTGKSA